jgi:hypothetical protein
MYRTAIFDQKPILHDGKDKSFYFAQPSISPKGVAFLFGKKPEQVLFVYDEKEHCVLSIGDDKEYPLKEGGSYQVVFDDTVKGIILLQLLGSNCVIKTFSWRQMALRWFRKTERF